MTIDEAKEICKKLTQINLSIWNAWSTIEKDKLRADFKSECRKLHDAGYKLRRWRQDGKPMFAPKVERHAEAVLIESNRPDGVNVKNDCTTRCLSFCTGVDYSTIKAEQLKNAREHGRGFYTWRHDRIWERSLMSRGFVKLVLDRRHVSRATFLKLAESLPVHDGKIATVSSSHVAAVDMSARKILDTWNSSGGRVKSIYVPEAQKDVYYRWLKAVGCCI